MWRRDTVREAFEDGLRRADVHPRPAQLTSYYSYLLDSFGDAHRVLDVGGGDGSLSFFASMYLASDVVTCLEPSASGSNDFMRRNFDRLDAELSLAGAVFRDGRTFQEFDDEAAYDLAIFHNSINHIDEAAVARLHKSRTSRETYGQYFKKLNGLLTDGGAVLVADASPRNFFGDMGITSPFAPTIDWQLHQPPELWAFLLERYGFSEAVVRWDAPVRTGRIGRTLCNSRTTAYFVSSHFVLTMSKTVTS